MKYLVVYAHPNPKSFNHAIKEEIVAKLKREGHEYVVRDLNELKFHPVLSGSDFTSFKQGKMPDDIKREQDHIRNADVLIFIYPTWWYGMPAILKGYIDRVFSYGFAYEFNEKGLQGLLPDKKVIIFNTTGGPAEYYAEAGYNDAIRKTIDAGTFELCAMKVLIHKFFYAVTSIDDAARKKMLDELRDMKF